MSAGDYRLFLSENAENRSLETGGLLAKARHWRAFLRVLGTPSPNARLPGWRCSAIRTRLHSNSLLTGNFTGKIAVLGLLGPNSWQEAAVPQRFFAQFPMRTNRENISRNREFSSENREFRLHSAGRMLGVRARCVLQTAKSPMSASLIGRSGGTAEQPEHHS